MSDWFVLFCETKGESKVANKLREKNFEVFYPFIRQTLLRKSSNGEVKRVTLENPQYPRYVFVKMKSTDTSYVKRVSGVLSIISSKDGPSKVPYRVMKSLQEHVSEDGCAWEENLLLPSQTFPLKIGDHFIFTSDHQIMAGFTGRIESLRRLDSHGEVGVFVPFLGADCRIAVPMSMVGAKIET